MTWWTKVKEEYEKYNFQGYTKEKAAKDALLFQTSNAKLRKKVLSEDTNLDYLVKLGLTMEHTEGKADQMGGSSRHLHYKKLPLSKSILFFFLVEKNVYF